ncbi:MAG: PAS domain-containing sensor histidine kinase, partial [Candidatus Aminicenantes bacterium]|nr:PAS domain-containing sensor histidine kinase [Candidatus Aminicenantes bacterium]
GESILLDFKNKGNDIILGGLNLDDILEHVPKMLKGNFEGTNRINKIISGLKDYSAIPSETELEIIDINKAIRFSITLLERKIKESSSELVTELEENLPGPQGIPQQIEQVIINLLQNSIIAMGTRRGKITISSHYNKKSDCIKIIVKDEGIGIEKKNLSRVTEPFFTTSRAHGGTGLGLYISYSIIKQHEGKIDIDSVRGKGTTITVSIPVRREIK